LADLYNFTNNAMGIQTTGQNSLVQLQTDTSSVLNGSYIVFSCISGYTNIGGSLNVTCNTNGVWSQFPQCVSNTSGGGSITTTTMSTSNGLPCMIDMATTFNITNGYSSSNSLAPMSNTAVTGN
jgi:hypothetical protein